VFAIKGILGTLLSPLVVAGLVGVGALVRFVCTRTRRFAVAILVLLVLFGYPVGTTPVANLIIRPLEASYVPVEDPGAVADLLGSQIRWVVVLGAGHVSDPRAAPPGRLTGEGLYRRAEGIRIWRSFPGARLHVSGRAGADTVSWARVAADAALSLGVPAEALAPGPRDTQEEARAAAERIPAGEPFFLVIGAAHLDRAIFFFEAAGLSPISVPAYFHSLDPPGLTLEDLLPSPENYLKVDRAVHEHLGILWAWLIVRGGE